MWNPATGTTGHTLTSPTGGVWAVVVAPDGSWLAAADTDGELRIWDPSPVQHSRVRHGAPLAARMSEQGSLPSRLKWYETMQPTCLLPLRTATTAAGPVRAARRAVGLR
ncbi:MAG: WD40 repeat domain-containing protein [Pseudonocardiaceae bacterium]